MAMRVKKVYYLEFFPIAIGIDFLVLFYQEKGQLGRCLSNHCLE